MAKVAWKPKQVDDATFATAAPGTRMAVGFMVKDRQRFADSGGWGWAQFNYDPALNTFTVATDANDPPRENDAKCGFACYTIAEMRNYVFTEYGER